ncbi:MAG: hypothetical protein CMG74_06770 [Candidatus Marinimicrobia bacterium]|nr:hypothetical protein [Candidatus Neomarinimicrobiota bacterium]
MVFENVPWRVFTMVAEIEHQQKIIVNFHSKWYKACVKAEPQLCHPTEEMIALNCKEAIDAEKQFIQKLKDMYQAQYGRRPREPNASNITWLINALRMTRIGPSGEDQKWFKLMYPEVWQWYNEKSRAAARAGRQLAEVRRKARHKWKINTEAAVAIQRAWLAKKKLKEQEVVAVYVPPAEAIDTESIASAPLAEAIDTEPELKGQYGF